MAALVMGSFAALVNSAHGVVPAATAGGKQAVYTFFFAGTIMQLCTRLASRPGRREPVIAVAVAIPFLVTVVLISIVHFLRGTPEPLLTVGVVATIGFPSFLIWARRTRDGLESAADSPGR